MPADLGTRHVGRSYGAWLLRGNLVRVYLWTGRRHVGRRLVCDYLGKHSCCCVLLTAWVGRYPCSCSFLDCTLPACMLLCVADCMLEGYPCSCSVPTCVHAVVCCWLHVGRVPMFLLIPWLIKYIRTYLRACTEELWCSCLSITKVYSYIPTCVYAVAWTEELWCSCLSITDKVYSYTYLCACYCVERGALVLMLVPSHLLD